MEGESKSVVTPRKEAGPVKTKGSSTSGDGLLERSNPKSLRTKRNIGSKKRVIMFFIFIVFWTCLNGTSD